MGSFIGVVTALVALLTGVLGLFKYLDVRSKRQQREVIGTAFKSTVSTLAGTDRVERLGSAILLRRFFSPSSEYAKPDMPYADEAVDVIAATLRGEPTGDLQKLLADGLAYVGRRGLRHRDFQRVNLRGGYLSLSGPAGHAVAKSTERRPGATEGRAWRRRHTSRTDDTSPRLRLDLSHADFFEADVSEASFTEDVCQDTVFYAARAVGAVFRGADLTGANFRDADLRRARFDGATLAGADFDGAHLGGARFANAEGVPLHISALLDDRATYCPPEPEVDARSVFVSAPGPRGGDDYALVDVACQVLRDHHVMPLRLRPEAYGDGHLVEVQAAMARCAGLVTIGLPQLTVASGVWRPGTEAEVALIDDVLPTPWNDIETGIAVGLGIPVLSIRAGCGSFGVFGLTSDVGFVQVDVAGVPTVDEVAGAIRAWLGEHVHASGRVAATEPR